MPRLPCPFSRPCGQLHSVSMRQPGITPDDAVMSFETEQRSFDNDEATTLHHLLDVLSLYCAESVVWWEEGQGTPVKPGTVVFDAPKTRWRGLLLWWGL